MDDRWKRKKKKIEKSRVRGGTYKTTKNLGVDLRCAKEAEFRYGHARV